MFINLNPFRAFSLLAYYECPCILNTIGSGKEIEANEEGIVKKSEDYIEMIVSSSKQKMA